MAEIEGKDGGRLEWVKRWKPGEPLPWAKFDWARWLATPALRRLTPEQRGRFMDVYAATHGTRTPGVMTEEDVRGWAGYSPAEWRLHRDAFAQVFNTTRTRGKWRLEDVVEVWKASMRVARRNADRSRKGVAARAQKAGGRKGLGTTGGTPSATPGRTDVREVRGVEESQRPSVPEVRSAQGGSAGHSPVASGGTVAVSDLLGRALRAGSADGTDGTDPRSRGAA